MTPLQRELVLALVVVPGRGEPLPATEFLQKFGSADGQRLGLDLLNDAVDRRDPIDVELALIVCFTFGFGEDHITPLEALAFADWHQRHEDVARALGTLRSPSSIDALVHLSEWVPEYLAFDDARALATKAIWSLGAIDDIASRHALEALTRSPEPIIARGARKQLER